MKQMRKLTKKQELTIGIISSLLIIILGIAAKLIGVIFVGIACLVFYAVYKGVKKT